MRRHFQIRLPRGYKIGHHTLAFGRIPCRGPMHRRRAMKICMVGQGAFAKKHLDGLARIKGVEVVTITGRSPDTTETVAKKYGIPHWTTNLEEALARSGVDAAI